jgi:hypothetical protein
LILTLLLDCYLSLREHHARYRLAKTSARYDAVTGTSRPGALLTSERGLTVEVNYGRRLFDSAIAGLTAELPLGVNFGEKTHYDLNLVPKDDQSFFVTPALRANLFPDNGISPRGECRGRPRLFQREFHAGVWRGQPRQNRGHDRNFQFGAGLDVKLFSRVSVRGEVRDFFSGVPQLNVDIGKTRQHNFFVGAGVVYHFSGKSVES